MEDEQPADGGLAPCPVVVRTHRPGLLRHVVAPVALRLSVARDPDTLLTLETESGRLWRLFSLASIGRYGRCTIPADAPVDFPPQGERPREVCSGSIGFELAPTEGDALTLYFRTAAERDAVHAHCDTTLSAHLLRELREVAEFEPAAPTELLKQSDVPIAHFVRHFLDMAQPVQDDRPAEPTAEQCEALRVFGRVGPPPCGGRVDVCFADKARPRKVTAPPGAAEEDPPRLSAVVFGPASVRETVRGVHTVHVPLAADVRVFAGPHAWGSTFFLEVPATRGRRQLELRAKNTEDRRLWVEWFERALGRVAAGTLWERDSDGASDREPEPAAVGNFEAHSDSGASDDSDSDDSLDRHVTALRLRRESAAARPPFVGECLITDLLSNGSKWATLHVSLSPPSTAGSVLHHWLPVAKVRTVVRVDRRTVAVSMESPWPPLRIEFVLPSQADKCWAALPSG